MIASFSSLATLRSALLLLVVFVLNSCAYYAIYLETGAKIYPPTDPAAIQFFVTDPDQAYTPIGAVAVDAINEKEALRKMRNRVVEVGADAVIRLELQHLASFTQRVSVSGVAVKLE